MARRNQINVEALRLQLFAAIERINHDNDGDNPLSVEEMQMEIDKARAIGELAKCLVDLAKVEVAHDVLQFKKVKEGEQTRKALPESTFFALEE